MCFARRMEDNRVSADAFTEGLDLSIQQHDGDVVSVDMRLVPSARRQRRDVALQREKRRRAALKEAADRKTLTNRRIRRILEGSSVAKREQRIRAGGGNITPLEHQIAGRRV